MIALALFFGWSLFIGGADFLAIHEVQARQLGIVIPVSLGAVPICCVAAYALAVFFLRRIQQPRIRWAAFAAATLLAHLPIILAADFLHKKSMTIPLAAPLTDEGLRQFEEAFHVKSIRSNKAIRVRRGDDSQAMAEFLQKLVAAQNTTP